MTDINDYIRLITGWASARNLINGSTPVNQYAKLMSEIGETAEAIFLMQPLEVMDGVGDSFVVLVIICAMMGISMETCHSSVMLSPVPFNKSGIVRNDQMDELMKVSRTLGKFGDAILKKDIESARLPVAAAVRSLMVIANMQSSTLVDRLASAYEEIKDRQGVIYNGTFIKATDPRYASAMREIKASATEA